MTDAAFSALTRGDDVGKPWFLGLTISTTLCELS